MCIIIFRTLSWAGRAARASYASEKRVSIKIKTNLETWQSRCTNYIAIATFLFLLLHDYFYCLFYISLRYSSFYERRHFHEVPRVLVKIKMRSFVAFVEEIGTDGSRRYVSLAARPNLPSDNNINIRKYIHTVARGSCSNRRYEWILDVRDTPFEQLRKPLYVYMYTYT